MINDSLKAVDLFCGCGGMSCGLQMAGVEVIAGIDVEAKYLATFSQNFPLAKSIEADISELSPIELMKKLEIKKGDLDILVGGPPCQGFSKNVPKKNRTFDDSRNQLVKTFLDYCEAIQPQFILMENVAEMKNGFEQIYSSEVVERLSNSGYAIISVVLNAADYGVPQRRRRAFFLATRLQVKLETPKATYFSTQKANTSQPTLFRNHHVTVWEAIGDLPSLRHGEGSNEINYALPAESVYQELMRVDSKAVRNHVARKLQPLQFSRLAFLQAGQGHDDLPKELQVKSGYSGAYGRLSKDMIAPTITRWVFHPGSGRWGHPVDIRTLTMREVARIQSFPDTYEFVGSYNDQAGQLGNAVPPLLTKVLVESLLQQVAVSKNLAVR
jgi:DNA (cytosine-5)-methyltransferase 1